MNQFLSIISDIRVVITIAVLVLILAVWLIVEKIRTKNYRKELEDLEQRYNDIKSVPLTIKLSKATVIARGDELTAKKVESAKNMFDHSQSSIQKISENLASCEDSILVGKLRKADDIMQELEKDLSLTDKEVKELDMLLDEVLAKDNRQRQQATNLKNRFRALKSSAQENATRLSFSWNAIEMKIAETEKMFSTFEDWTFSGDYDKANAELRSIESSMKEIEALITRMPSLLEDARGVIPNMAEELKKEYAHNRARGVYLKHLEIEKNLSTLTQMLKADLTKLQNGNMENISENIITYKNRLTQMITSVRSEGEAYDQMKVLSKETAELANEANQNAKFVRQGLTSASVKFGLEGMMEQLEKDEADLKRLNDQVPNVIDNVGVYQIPASTVLVSLNELHDGFSVCNDSLKEMRSKIEAVTSDEDRIRKELVKLQIIMNQMQVKIRKYKLPNISDTYQMDMKKADEYITKLQTMVDETPINIQLVSSVLQDALDFIYKLYNNVNNVVGTVAMVENTIVFGNRYRSTYADIDSELTRSELCFRNGEYTQALTIAIATIEKIHPGNYESMIKENAKGA